MKLTAIPELFELIDMKGALITADAISCQKSIASKCIEKEADYLLAVKSNQKTLQKDIQTVVEAHWEPNPVDQPSDTFAEQENTDHGRKEYRCCWVFDDFNQLSTHMEWQGLKQFGVTQSDRTIDGIATTALRLYITSKAMTVEEMRCATRTTGKWRTMCTGSRILPSMKMLARLEMKIEQKICPFCGELA